MNDKYFDIYFANFAKSIVIGAVVIAFLLFVGGDYHSWRFWVVFVAAWGFLDIVFND